MELLKSLKISAAGMKAQGTRLRVIAENLANSSSMAATANGEPYRRKQVIFQNLLDRATGADLVRVSRVVPDMSDFAKEFNPSHPAADATGYVLKPNVNALTEMMDMREAQRSYEANLNVIEAAKTMIGRTIELLRG